MLVPTPEWIHLTTLTEDSIVDVFVPAHARTNLTYSFLFDDLLSNSDKTAHMDTFYHFSVPGEFIFVLPFHVLFDFLRI